MSFEMTEEQRLAVDGLRRYLDDIIEPEFLAHGEGFIPREKMQKWARSLSEFGLMTAPHPESLGGLGMDWRTHLYLWDAPLSGGVFAGWIEEPRIYGAEVTFAF